MKNYQKRYVLLFMLSSLLHLGGYWWYVYFFPLLKTEPELQPSVMVTLQLQPKPEELIHEKAPEQVQIDTPDPLETEQPEEVVHAPRHTADEFSSDNQDDEAFTEIIAGVTPTSEVDREPQEDSKQAEAANQAFSDDVEKHHRTQQAELADEMQVAGEFLELDQTAQRDVVVSHQTQTGESASDPFQQGASLKQSIANALQSLSTNVSDTSQQEPFEVQASLEELIVDPGPTVTALEIPDDFLKNIGNMRLLSDSSLRDAEVKQPFSKKKSQELELANRYLELMNKQVRQFWINPYKGGRLFQGIIKVELNVKGYLESAEVYRRSGHALLDISVLDAIRAVPRFAVPDDEVITNRYYRHMSFHYSSIEMKTELMPFETARLEKEDS